MGINKNNEKNLDNIKDIYFEIPYTRLENNNEYDNKKDIIIKNVDNLDNLNDIDLDNDRIDEEIPLIKNDDEKIPIINIEQINKRDEKDIIKEKSKPKKLNFISPN